eukprot:SAG31_NODE_1271_length_9064_cov_10.148912_9_plen_51_part_00
MGDEDPQPQTGYDGQRNEDGQRDGVGEYTFEDGSKYIGSYKNGCREGMDY